MKYKTLVPVLAVVFLLGWSAAGLAEEGGFASPRKTTTAPQAPPSPPAKLCGHIDLDGSPVVRNDGATIVAVVNNKTKITGKIDPLGRYSFVFPAGTTIKTGNKVKIILTRKNKKLTYGQLLYVPEFGSLGVTDISFADKKGGNQ